MLQASELAVFFRDLKTPETEYIEWHVSTPSFIFFKEIYYSKYRGRVADLFYIKNSNKTEKANGADALKFALGQPRFHVPEGLKMAVSRNFPRKIYFNLKISLS